MCYYGFIHDTIILIIKACSSSILITIQYLNRLPDDHIVPNQYTMKFCFQENLKVTKKTGSRTRYLKKKIILMILRFFFLTCTMGPFFRPSFKIQG